MEIISSLQRFYMKKALFLRIKQYYQHKLELV